MRVVRQQADGTHAERGERLRRLAVLPGVSRQAEAVVGLDRVGALLLRQVRPQLVEQPDAATLVTRGVDEDTPALGGDDAQAVAQLDSTVTPQRSQRVAGEALGVHSSEDAGTTFDRAEDERDVDEPGWLLERVRVEHPVGGRQRYSHGLGHRHGSSVSTRAAANGKLRR